MACGYKWENGSGLKNTCTEPENHKQAHFDKNTGNSKTKKD